MPLLARTNPDRPPFLIVELPLDGEVTSAQPVQAQAHGADPVVKSA
jgi:hypothetical protein